MFQLHELAERFKEPSSWAGIASLVALFGVHLDAGVAHDIALVGAGLAGIVAFFTPEKN